MTPLTPEQRAQLYQAFNEVDDPSAGAQPHPIRETLGFACEGFVTYQSLLHLAPILAAIREDLVPKADIELLLRVVRERFLNMDAAESNAIVLAIEGLRWLVGDDSVVTRDSLEREAAAWREHSVMGGER